MYKNDNLATISEVIQIACHRLSPDGKILSDVQADGAAQTIAGDGFMVSNDATDDLITAILRMLWIKESYFHRDMVRRILAEEKLVAIQLDERCNSNDGK